MIKYFGMINLGKHMKVCTKCNQLKPRELFYKMSAAKDGLHPSCKECKRISDKSRYLRNSKEICEKQRERYQADKERQREKAKERYRRTMQNEEKRKIRRAASTLWERRKREADVSFRISKSFSGQIAKQIKKNNKSWKTMVGYTLNELMNHLEAQFDKKMTWDNYGSYWHIDHIVPKSAFNIKKSGDDEFNACWCLSNLRPLEAFENMKKNKYRTHLI